MDQCRALLDTSNGMLQCQYPSSTMPHKHFVNYVHQGNDGHAWALWNEESGWLPEPPLLFRPDTPQPQNASARQSAWYAFANTPRGNDHEALMNALDRYDELTGRN